MKLTAEQMQTFLDLANNLEAQVRWNYSGRGMYGTECVALISNLSPVQMAMEVTVAFSHDTELVEKMKECVKVDSMGKSNMIYFPGITA